MVHGIDQFISQVEFYGVAPTAWQGWRLVPVSIEGKSTPSQSQSSSKTLGLGPPPTYDGDATGKPPTRAQHVEAEQDEFGTIVSEVTVVTTTTTTRKKYRVEDA